MRIPRYWAKTESSASDAGGKPLRLTIWGWSHESVADAAATAQQRLADVVRRVTGGIAGDSYGYGRTPLREEILRSLGEPDTPSEAVITRNRYGAEVLNTAQVPFIDVDAPEDTTGSRLKSLFSRRPATSPVLEAMRQACQLNGRFGFRIYRTHSGYRLLVTNSLLDPRGAETQTLLAAFRADAAFAALCRAQGSFRARLTPKPWRCDCPLPPGQHPREDASTREAFAAWLERYRSASAAYATCKFVESFGSALPSSAARVIVEEHDRATRSDADLPLA
jgi:hypothetical protein